MGRRARFLWVGLLLLTIFVNVVEAQEPDSSPQQPEITLGANATFYADNTEFSNPFREGETLLGTFASVFVDARLSDRLVLRGGVFGNQRFGSDDGFDEVRPVLALIIGNPRSQLILGTLDLYLDRGRRVDGSGPDRTGPHGLLPPLQRETLAFERPWEAGLQWLVDGARVRQDAWVHWQRLNTREQREIFDAGLTSRVRLRESLALRTDVHLVHQGGQLSASSAGPVADSVAGAVGVEAGNAVPPLDRVSLEGYALVSRYVPDRETTAGARTGFGTFIRAVVEERGWRAHVILWRGSDFIKAEGDPHYLSLRRDGSHYNGLRDYAEAGLTRTFALARESWLEASARWHRVENDYEYSFRILAHASLRLLLMKSP
jgi:hypothetical protein